MTFVTDPKDALVVVTDKYGDRVWPFSDPTWKLQTGDNYTWTATKKGYIGKQDSFRVTSDTVSINLTKASANNKIDTSITAEWGNFRKGDDELGLTDAKTPYNPEDVELLWAAKYLSLIHISGKIAEADAEKTELAYDFDVNLSSKVDINDAQLTYDMYNAKYEDFDTVSMHKFLDADVTGDGKLTVEDATAVVNSFIK